MLPEFLNVDLDLESNQPLDALVAELGDRVHVLHHGPLQEVAHYLSLEVYEGDDHDPDSIVGAFCDLIEGLSVKSTAIWKKCNARRFDIGIMSGTTKEKNFKVLQLDFEPKTLKRIAALSAQVVITVYPKAPISKKK